MRTNSAASSGRTRSPAPSPTDGAESSDRIREETEDGVEYTVIKTTAQTEGVYRYPTTNGVTREFVDGEELTQGGEASEWDNVPLLLRHPIVNVDGEPQYGLTTGPKATYATVGSFRDDGRSTPDTLRGEVWIRSDQIGRHGGDLEGYVNAVAAGEFGDVSTGYDSTPVVNHGSYGGESYEAIQTDIRPDHVALLPDEPGNCSIADGCGVGRVNGEPSDTPRTPRLNADQLTDNHMSDPDTTETTPPDPADTGELDAEDVSRLRSAWGTLSGLLNGADASTPHADGPEPDPDNTGEDDEPAPESEPGDDPDGEPENEDESQSDEEAEPSAGPDDSRPTDEDTSMKDKTKELVEKHGFKAENLPDEGEDCFNRIYEQFAGTETATDGGENPGDEPAPEDEPSEPEDEPAEPESPDTPNEEGASGEQVVVNKDDLADIVDQRVEERLEAEQSSAERAEHETAIVNSSAPYSAEDLEPMNDEAVRTIAERHDVHSQAQTQPASSGRSNYAGVPTPRSNADEVSTETASVAGVGNRERNESED